MLIEFLMRRKVMLKLRYIFNATWKKMSCFMLYVVLLLLRMTMISTLTRIVNLFCEVDFGLAYDQRETNLVKNGCSLGVAYGLRKQCTGLRRHVDSHAQKQSKGRS